MVEIFKELQRRAKKALNFKTQSLKAIKKEKKRIENLNRGQLLEGLDANDKSLGVYRDFSYKNRLEPVDLKLTGDFHRSITANFSDEGIVISATDEKSEMLQDRYGDDILGLDELGMNKLRDAVKENLLAQIKKDLL